MDPVGRIRGDEPVRIPPFEAVAIELQDLWEPLPPAPDTLDSDGEIRVNEKDGAATLDIVVQPRCPRECVGPVVGDRLKVSVNAPR